MKFEIHYTIEDHEDHLIIEGESIEEIRGLAKIETERRGLTEEKNNLWSKPID